MATTHGRKGRPWRRIRAEILAASNICWLCGRPGSTTVDHVIPLSQRPDLAHERSNLRPAHMRCNSRKGVRPLHLTRPTTASRPW